MLYTMLNSEVKVAVPFLFTVFFIMMYIKYHRDKDVIPEILYSNLINALGCFLSFVFELFMYKGTVEYVLLDFSNIIMLIGAFILIRGTSKHKKYGQRKIPIYTLYLLLVCLIIGYIAISF